MAGTIYQGSTTPLQLWFYAMFLFTKSRNGVSGKELQRQLGVTYKTAWRMGHKIREHMARVDGDHQLGGSGKIVQVDETYIGGRTNNKNKFKNKAVVQGMLEHDGDVITRVTSDIKRETLMKNINENIKSGTEIHTDELPAYSRLTYSREYTHKKVHHRVKEYVGRDGQTTNSIEGFFMHLKRTIKGTHIWVSAKHLHKYTGEAEFMYNRRQRPLTMLPELLSTFPNQA
jgi:transposase-like protein